MGRRRIQKALVTTLAVSIHTAEIMRKLKGRRETQDGFICRMLAEWQDSKEVIKDMETAYNYQAKRIEQYEAELERLKQLVEQNPTIQELR
jgi:hypothetical protein